MRRKKSPFLVFPGFSICVAVFLSLLSLPLSAAGQKIEIKNENGVVVVRNPKKPVPQPGGPSKLVLTEDLVIGREQTPAGYVFADLRSVGVDDQENIRALDWEDDKVRVFDKTGQLISAFGKKGQGPGELESPSRMIVTPDGIGVILDRNKLTFYSRDGRCLKELSTGLARMFRFKIDSKGNIYADKMVYEEKMTLSLIKYDPALNPVATLAEVEEPVKPGAFNAFTILLFCHVTGDDRLVWMANSKYEFFVLNPEGKLIRKIIKDYEPLKVTDADKKRILEEDYGDAPFRNQIVFPGAHPPVFFFIGDAEGRLYAQTYEPAGKGGLWHDVFDPEGRCITRFSLPRGETAFIVKKNKLYVLIQENEEGIPLVKRYALEWK